MRRLCHALLTEDESIEEGLMGVVYMRFIRQLNDKPPLPQVFPLKTLMLKEQQRIPEYQYLFKRENNL